MRAEGFILFPRLMKPWLRYPGPESSANWMPIVDFGEEVTASDDFQYTFWPVPVPEDAIRYIQCF